MHADSDRLDDLSGRVIGCGRRLSDGATALAEAVGPGVKDRLFPGTWPLRDDSNTRRPVNLWHASI